MYHRQNQNGGVVFVKTGSEAQLLVLFIISELPDEASLSELCSILVSCGELEPMDIGTYIDSLSASGHILISDSTPSQARHDAARESSPEKYVSITDTGMSVAEAFSAEKQLCRSAINRALRQYKKLTCGIEYNIKLEKAKGGSYVHFEMLINEKSHFRTALFFADSAGALAVYNRMDENPDAFYARFLTVATGEVEYM